MFVSYAQNFEDVILWRALKHVDSGFYIDIGAQDPKLDSVSYAFYRNGWRGVHVEPVAAYAAALRRERPDELVIEAVVGDQQDEVTFYELQDTGLSTTQGDVAAQHAASGRDIRAIRRQSVRLSEILERHRDREIHWLKIDVEGDEASVIRSWGSSGVRPWIVVVESIDPISRYDTSGRWEAELLALGYWFVYRDGINRFYLHNEHHDLLIHFTVAPNLFDDFTLSGTQSAPFSAILNERLAAREAELNKELAVQAAILEAATREHAARETDLSSRLAEQTSALETVVREHDARAMNLSIRIADANREIARLHQVIHEQSEWSRASVRHVDSLTAELSSIKNSRSWRLTQPLRSSAWMMHTFALRARSAPGAIVRRVAGMVRSRSPRLYGQIAVNPLVRRLYLPFARPPVGAHAATARAGTPLAPAVPRDTSDKHRGSFATAGSSPAEHAARPSLETLTSAMRLWNLGRRLDA